MLTFFFLKNCPLFWGVLMIVICVKNRKVNDTRILFLLDITGINIKDTRNCCVGYLKWYNLVLI